MEQNKDKDLKQRIIKYLVKGPSNDVSLECDVCKSEDEANRFYSVLEEMVNNKVIDWHPYDKNTSKDELVPYGKFLRRYHIARPDFSEITNYFKKLAMKIKSKLYH